MLQDYLEKKRRNKVKKQLRRVKPYLMGDKLEQEIDRIMGIADSGKMDWVVAVESGKTASEYPTPESITYEKLVETAEKFMVRPYILYWFFFRKVDKQKTSGRKSSDYLAMLTECAVRAAKADLKSEEKVMALKAYSRNYGQELSQDQIERMIFTGEV